MPGSASLKINRPNPGFFPLNNQPNPNRLEKLSYAQKLWTFPRSNREKTIFRTVSLAPPCSEGRDFAKSTIKVDLKKAPDHLSVRRSRHQTPKNGILPLFWRCTTKDILSSRNPPLVHQIQIFRIWEIPALGYFGASIWRFSSLQKRSK